MNSKRFLSLMFLLTVTAASFMTALPIRAAQNVFMLDAGHGGKDPGAMHNGRNEKDDNLKIALAVGERLERSGEKVLYTRTDDTFLELSERADKANSAGSDYFVSFHRNSADTVGRGVEVYYYSKLTAASTAARLASPVQTALVSCGFRDRGVKSANFAVLRQTSMPAILIELGFINNDSENAKLDAELDSIADAIASALLSFVGKALIPVTTNPTTTEVPETQLPTTEPVTTEAPTTALPETEPLVTTTSPSTTKPDTTSPHTTKPQTTVPQTTVPNTTEQNKMTSQAATDPPSSDNDTIPSDTGYGSDSVTESGTVTDAISENGVNAYPRLRRYIVLAVFVIAAAVGTVMIITKRR